MSSSPLRLRPVLAVLVLCQAPRAADAALSKVEIAKIGKAATALVELKEARAYGSAFCVHPSGLFVTNEHVIRPAAPGGGLTLILNPGLKSQKVLRARVLRSDRELDLALLQAEDARDLPALALGSDEGLTELMEVVALGFPFGTALANDDKAYPAISINTGHVTALRHKEGRLHRIQLDAALNPGNSGGPVLDERGQVVGVVVAGVRGSGVNFAIPADEVRRFAYRADIQLLLPLLTRATMHRAASFRARVTSAIPSPKPLDLELILTAGDGKEQRHKMEFAGGLYRAQAVPVPPASGPRLVRVTVRYDQGSVSGSAADQKFKVGDKEYELSGVRRVEFRPKAQVVLPDGKAVRGAISGLDGLVVQLGDEAVRLTPDRVVSLRCEAPAEADAVACVVVASRDGKEVGRAGDSIPIEGIGPRPSEGPAVGPVTTPALAQDRVVRALPSALGDLAVGGGGRFLVFSLPKLRRLGVFDVNSVRVVKYIPVEEDDVKFAAARDRLVIILPGRGVIQRWNLATLERELAVQLPTRGRVTVAAMGAASRGPLLLGAGPEGRCSFLDLDTLRPLDVRMPENRPGGLNEGARVRASADGRVFGVWRTDTSPQGMQTLVLVGRQLHVHNGPGAGHVTPGPDGRVVFTGQGLYTTELKPRKEDNDGGAAYCVPAAQGPLYLSFGTGAKAPVAVHTVGQPGPLARLTDVEAPGPVDPWDRERFGLDRRVHLIPDAGVLITIPASNDRLVLHRFDLLGVLKKADVDYLLVMSQPPPVAKKGEVFTYQLAVLSRKGGVKYRVESGPRGMEVSPGGLVRWRVPAGAEEAEVSVILTVTDGAGQEVFHTFTVSLRE